MHSTLNRLAAGTFAVLFALASVNVATARADDYDDGPVTSTSCGAGTIAQCGMESIIKCEIEIEINVNIFSRDFGFHFKETNCRPVGERPIYKDKPKQVLLEGCDPMSQMLGASRMFCSE